MTMKALLLGLKDNFKSRTGDPLVELCILDLDSKKFIKQTLGMDRYMDVCGGLAIQADTQIPVSITLEQEGFKSNIISISRDEKMKIDFVEKKA